MLKKILNKFVWQWRKALGKAGIKRTIIVNGSPISLDYTHKLPDYQKRHPLYDRFLPHLVSYLTKDSVVIDVGANVGDTLSGMAGANPTLQYVCIEAADDFFADLKKNSEILKSRLNILEVTLVKQFIGNDIDSVNLSGSGGTKHAEIGGYIKSKTLYEVVSDLKIPVEKIRLIKTDVDGFDWDVIRSSYDLLGNHPYIFFECQYDSISQLNNYKDMFNELLKIGYANYSIFDNFGQYICTLNNSQNIVEFLDYVANQNFSNHTRTIFYYDVLAYDQRDLNAVQAILGDYKNLTPHTNNH